MASPPLDISSTTKEIEDSEVSEIESLKRELARLKEEKVQRELIASIRSRETQASDESDDKKLRRQVSSFENMPATFAGIKTSTFGLSSYNIKNPFLQIAAYAKNPQTSWEDRTQAVRYMQRIPHIQRLEHAIEATLSILKDEQYPLAARYHFFSNNEKIIKLDYELVNAGHAYFFNNFSSFKSPLLYRILSAQHLLTQFPLGTYDLEAVQGFLISVATDPQAETHYRAECADILERTGYGAAKTTGAEVISELGSLYTENRKRTIYTNAQNVHDTTVNKTVIDSLRELVKSTTPSERNSEEIYNSLIASAHHRGVAHDETDDKKECTEKDQTEAIKSAVIEVFQRILIDTARYEGLAMSEIMMLVWERIVHSENRRDLETRLFDEFYEMHKTCSTGHISRLMNVLSGFFQDIQPVRISYREQLRNNVFARCAASIRTLGSEEQEAISDEMISESKPQIEDFLFSYSPRDELYEEFVKTEASYLSTEEFEEVYTRAIRDFFGYED